MSGGGGLAWRGTGWLDRAQAWRDGLVASPRFRRWAAAFPPTRPIARRRTRALFDLCAGFVYSQVLAACVQLRLFEILAEGPRTAAALAARLSIPLDSAERLLRAAASLGLVARRGGGRFGLGPLGAALVGNAAVIEMVRHHAMLYADLADPVALLRRDGGATRLGAYWPYAEAPAGSLGAGSLGAGSLGAGSLGAGAVADYTALMAASQPMVADEVLGAYRMGRHRCLLDVGGGDGSFLIAAAGRAPGLRVALFDLPPVAARARARFAAAGLSGRATAVGGDFLADPLPGGADAVSLVRVIHDHGDVAALAILRAARRALPKGGALLLAEPMAGTPGAEPIGDAYFGFYLLAMGSGRARTAAGLTALLEQAGFDRVRRRRTRTPLLTGLLVARAA